MTKLKVIASLLGVSMLVVPASVMAAEFIAPKDNGGSVVLSSSEEHKNLYVAGANITLGNKTLGDLFAAGAMINVDGAVEQDAMLAGSNVSVRGAVGGDVRVGGGNVTIASPVGGDVLAAGGTVTILDSANLQGDVALAGGEVVLSAPVAGSLKIVGGNVTINSRVGGDVVVKAGEILRFGPRAEVKGRITYYGKKEAVVEGGAQVGAIDMRQYKRGGEGRHEGWKGVLGGIVVHLLAVIIVGLLLIKFFGKSSEGVVNGVLNRPWLNAGVGLLALIGTPIVIIIGFVFFIGYFASLILLAAYLLVIALACAYSYLFVGAWVAQKLMKRPELVLDWQAVVIGAAIGMLICLIPIIGWAVGFAVFVVVVGSLVRFALKRESV